MVKYLFVTGVARSGTSIITRILNRHSRILLGLERYKFVALGGGKAKEFNADLFERERFFDVRPTDTNIRQPDVPGQQAKFDRVDWLGDKVPGLYRRAKIVFDRFPDAMMVCMLRNPLDVAASWHARALKEGDRWPRSNDFFRGIEEWNKANATLMDLRRAYPGKITFLRYENLLTGGDAALGRILARLDLEPEVAVSRFAARQFAAYAIRKIEAERFEALRDQARPGIDTRSFDALSEASVA